MPADAAATTNAASVIWFGVTRVVASTATTTAATGRQTNRFQKMSGVFFVLR